MGRSDRLTLNRSRSSLGLINVTMELAAQTTLPELRLIGDYLANEAATGRKKNAR